MVVLLDAHADNQWLVIFLIMLGVVITLFGCNLAGTPAFNARIGGVTFILVVLTKTGTDKIAYALFRLLSTLYGVVVIVTAVFSFFSNENG